MLAVLGPGAAEQVVAVLATGSGKSLIFMVGATLRGAGTTIVVVPTVALRDNLVERMQKADITTMVWAPGDTRSAALAKSVAVHGFAHITGGGLTENIPRVVPAGLEVLLSAQTWTMPSVFEWLQRAGNIPKDEMYRTFNCGIGMTVCVAAEHCDRALTLLRDHGEYPVVIGEVRRGDGGVIIRG
jgi:phosphoribosylaminoimidazole (AIR) synthetase